MNIVVVALSDDAHARANQLAKELNLPLATPSTPCDYALLVDTNQLSLSAPNTRFTPLSITFKKQRKHLGKRPNIVKACVSQSTTPITILDLSGGLGQDAYTLASYGHTVIALERNPIVYALLNDACERLSQANPLFARHMQCLNVSALDYLQEMGSDAMPHVIVFDPMYPLDKKTKLNKKAMRMLRDLVGDDLDAEAVFEAALTRAKQRIVVKRPSKAPTLNDLTPDWQIKGQSVRFDVFVPRLRRRASR